MDGEVHLIFTVQPVTEMLIIGLYSIENKPDLLICLT